MPLRRRSLLAAALLGLVSVAFVGGSSTAWADAAPYPGSTGPFAVGHESFVLTDAAREELYAGAFGPRKLAVDVWYPVDPAAAAGELAVYSFQVFTLSFTSPRAFEDATPTPGVARPLIVFSHGSGGISVQSTELCETLASHGFVVAAPNHTGNTASDGFFGLSLPFQATANNRPRDVSAVIDRMLARSRDPQDRLYHVVNPFQIGVAGHSFGGFTALAVASGYGDYVADARVRAIMPIAPAARILTDAQLAKIQVPTFVLGGTIDSTTPTEPNSRISFEKPAARRVYRADILNAGHSHFASVCRLGQVLFDLGSPPAFVQRNVPGYTETCSPTSFPIEEAERIQSFYAVSFFRRHLLQDSRYETFLTLPYAQIMEPHVSFQRRAPSFPPFWQAFLASLERLSLK